MTKQNDAFLLATATIGPMLKDIGRGSPRWRTIADKMSKGEDAAVAWRLLAPASAGDVLRLLDMIRQAADAATREAARPPKSSDERADIQSVIELAKSLKRAIRLSSLPGGVNCGIHELQPAEGLKPVDVDFGWHSTSAEHSLSGYSISVDEMLKWTIEQAQRHLDTLPMRAGARRSGGEFQSFQKVFVRHLAWHFGKHFGDERRGAIARIATALFSPPDPPDHADVEAMLKDRPPAFDGRPKAPTKRTRQGARNKT